MCRGEQWVEGGNNLLSTVGPVFCYASQLKNRTNYKRESSFNYIIPVYCKLSRGFKVQRATSVFHGPLKGHSHKYFAIFGQNCAKNIGS